MKRYASFMLVVFSVFALFACSKSGNEAPVGDATLNPRFSQQAQTLETALRDDPNSKDVLIQLGNLYYDWSQDEIATKGDLAQPADKCARAIEYYKRALDIDPTNVNVRVDMGYMMQSMGQVDEALSEYRKGIQQDPKHAPARINAIYALGVKQEYKTALAEYDDLLKVAPDQKNNQNLTQVVEEFKKAMKETKK